MTIRPLSIILASSIGVQQSGCSHYGSIKTDISDSDSNRLPSGSEPLPAGIWEHISGFIPCSALNAVSRFGSDTSAKTTSLRAVEIEQRFELLLAQTSGIDLDISDLNVFEPVVTLNVSSIKSSMVRYLQDNHIENEHSTPRTTWKGIESSTDNLFLLFVLTRVKPCVHDEISRIGILLIVFDGDSMSDNFVEMHCIRCSFSRCSFCRSNPSSTLRGWYKTEDHSMSVPSLERLITYRKWLMLNNEADVYEDWEWGKVTQAQLMRARVNMDLQRRHLKRSCFLWILCINQIISIYILMFCSRHATMLYIALILWYTGIMTGVCYFCICRC